MELITEKRAAAMTGHSVRTYQKWRREGVGPPFRRLRRTVRYDVGELRAWADAGRCRSAPQAE